jgi:hypothetical protein
MLLPELAIELKPTNSYEGFTANQPGTTPLVHPLPDKQEAAVAHVAGDASDD